MAALASLYSSCRTGGYLGGLCALAHQGRHSTTVSGSGPRKKGIEYRSSVMPASPATGGKVTRWSVDFRKSAACGPHAR